jgi:hypothetical protein
VADAPKGGAEERIGHSGRDDREESAEVMLGDADGS